MRKLLLVTAVGCALLTPDVATGDAVYHSQHIGLYPFSTSCAGEPVVIPTAQLSTNGSGNGKAQVFFRPSDVGASLRNATHGIRWQVTTGRAAVYETDCPSVTLD